MPAVVRSCPEERKITELITMRGLFSNRSVVTRSVSGPAGLIGSGVSGGEDDFLPDGDLAAGGGRLQAVGGQAP